MSQFYELTIDQIRSETEEARFVRFAVPERLHDVFEFQPGQYLTFKAVVGGEELQRSYSICAASGEPVAVAIKKVPNGRFSTYAHEVFAEGQTVSVLPPAGNFCPAAALGDTSRYLCIAAGSGITPILSIVTTVLVEEPNSRVTLLYGNRQASSMMFKESLSWLKNKYLDRFQWINLFTRERQPADILNGRIDNKKGGELNRYLINIRGYDQFFLCGPEALISEVSRGLRGEWVDESQIHYELFFASAEDAQAVLAKHQARVQQFGGASKQVRVRSGGRETTFELSADGENILDAAIASGLDLPFSCKGGVCATCRARLIEGEIEMDLNHALSAQEVADGHVLTCQAHPISDRVAIDFDAN